MKCPFCGKEMQQGKLRTRGDNYFVPNGCKALMLYTKKAWKTQAQLWSPPTALARSTKKTGRRPFYALDAERSSQTFRMVA